MFSVYGNVFALKLHINLNVKLIKDTNKVLKYVVFHSNIFEIDHSSIYQFISFSQKQLILTKSCGSTTELLLSNRRYTEIVSSNRYFLVSYIHSVMSVSYVMDIYLITLRFISILLKKIRPIFKSIVVYF